MKYWLNQSNSDKDSWRQINEMEYYQWRAKIVFGDVLKYANVSIAVTGMRYSAA